MTCFNHSLRKKNPRVAELFAYFGWSIWHNRNARKFGTVTVPIGKIYIDAIRCLHEFHMAQDLAPMHEADFHPTHWLPPPLSFYKINYDGVTFQDSALAGLGVVVRYSNGWVIAAPSKRITLPPTVEVLEALACRKAVSFVIDLDIQDVVFEGDSEVIFKHLSSDQPSMAAFGHIVDDARSLAARLRSFHFSHTKRKGNMVADKLAQFAKVLYEPKIWLEPRGHSSNF